MRQSSRRRSLVVSSAVLASLLLAVATAPASRAKRGAPFRPVADVPAVDWPTADGFQGTHRSPLADVRRDNVRDLEVAWTYRTGDAAALAGSLIRYAAFALATELARGVV